MEYTIKVRTDSALVKFVYSLLDSGIGPNVLEDAADFARSTKEVELRRGPMAIMAQEVARVIEGHGTIREGVTLKLGEVAGIICSKCGEIFPSEKWPFTTGIKPRWVLDIDAGKCPKCGDVWKKQGFGIDVPGSEKAV
jgi:hypothetical protein